MSAFIDLTGQQFSRLTANSYAGYDAKGHSSVWNCTCECGVKCPVNATHLRSGHTTSCGCRAKEVSAENGRISSTKHGHARHNGKRSRTYRSWEAMLRRVGNRDGYHPSYVNVSVCKRWDTKRGGSFENFYKDMGERPVGATLHRIHGKLVYCKRNCKWEVLAQQGRDKAVTKLTMQKAMLIRRLRAQGVKNITSAQRFDVSEQVICDIIKNRKWKEITTQERTHDERYTRSGSKA